VGADLDAVLAREAHSAAHVIEVRGVEAAATFAAVISA